MGADAIAVIGSEDDWSNVLARKYVVVSCMRHTESVIQFSFGFEHLYHIRYDLIHSRNRLNTSAEEIVSQFDG